MYEPIAVMQCPSPSQHLSSVVVGVTTFVPWWRHIISLYLHELRSMMSQAIFIIALLVSTGVPSAQSNETDDPTDDRHSDSSDQSGNGNGNIEDTITSTLDS
ncbi:unnamed protein product, partial [Anisakis simplex]|uniref:Secreted protein n=1 Tax=Anisakis simplex TaxID=6269 RepID=A0A0M3KGU1_ANISI